MPGNTFGKLFKITTCGESHGGAVGVIIDGCPAGFALTAADIQRELDRRKPGQSRITTPRKENDIIHILSGVFNGFTTGTPILMLAYNTDMRPEDYATLKDVYRPSHADFTYQSKYGRRDHRGSGRASARETLARVAAGALAKKILKQQLNIEIIAYVQQVGDIQTLIDYNQVTALDVETNPVRCPDKAIAPRMIALIEAVQKDGDSIGGIIQCVIRNIMPGLGDPVFDKLNADLAKAMLSINAAKGFELGSGFACAGMRGSEHNDPMIMKNCQPAFLSNHAGGILGGISTGEPIPFRVAFKPVSTIQKTQNTVTLDNQNTILSTTGRHDACVLPRAVPIVEAMAALVVLDHYLRFRNAHIEAN
jgi:chorismate synthase